MDNEGPKFTQLVERTLLPALGALAFIAVTPMVGGLHETTMAASSMGTSVVVAPPPSPQPAPAPGGGGGIDIKIQAEGKVGLTDETLCALCITLLLIFVGTVTVLIRSVVELIQELRRQVRLKRPWWRWLLIILLIILIVLIVLVIIALASIFFLYWVEHCWPALIECL